MSVETKSVKAGILYLDEQMKNMINGDKAAVVKNRMSFLVHSPEADPELILQSLKIIEADLLLEIERLKKDKQKVDEKSSE